MWAALIGPVASLIGKAIDRAVPDQSQAAELKAKIIGEAQALARTELQGAIDIIIAEASSQSWITRNWRPITMLTFVGLVVAHWLGWTAPNLPPEQVLALLEIVKVGLGGYVVGRSVEQAAKAWRAKD